MSRATRKDIAGKADYPTLAAALAARAAVARKRGQRFKRTLRIYRDAAGLYHLTKASKSNHQWAEAHSHAA